MQPKCRDIIPNMHLTKVVLSLRPWNVARGIPHTNNAKFDGTIYTQCAKSCLVHIWKPVGIYVVVCVIDSDEYGSSYRKWYTYIINMPICFWFNSSPPSAAYMRQWIGSALVPITACRLFGAKPLSNQCWIIVNWGIMNKVQWNFNQNTKRFIHKMHLTISSA